MLKTIFYTILITIAICGAVWFTIGRITTANLFRTIDKTDRDLERVEQLVSDFGSDFDRYAGKVALLGTSSSGVGREIRGIREDFQSEIGDRRSEYGDIQSRFQFFTNGINSVEKSVRRSVVLNRDFADVLFWYRRRGETDEEAN